MVRLKDDELLTNIHVDDGFNSTMVRLKAVSLSIALSQHSFQFHNGSIKRKVYEEYLEAEQEVSIPQWFD